jgi:hypothetical protein
MTDPEASCPVCGERLPLQGLSFLMINVVVERHSKTHPGCNLQIEFFAEEKRVEIKRALDEGSPPGKE